MYTTDETFTDATRDSPTSSAPESRLLVDVATREIWEALLKNTCLGLNL